MRIKVLLDAVKKIRKFFRLIGGCGQCRNRSAVFSDCACKIRNGGGAPNGIIELPRGDFFILTARHILVLAPRLTFWRPGVSFRRLCSWLLSILRFFASICFLAQPIFLLRRPVVTGFRPATAAIWPLWRLLRAGPALTTGPPPP